MDSLDKECARCHGTGIVPSASKTVPQQSTPAGAVPFNFDNVFAADEERARKKEKHRKIINRVVTFMCIYLLTQYGFSLYNRNAFEREILARYNQELRESGSSVTCSSVELKGFGLFGTTEASGHIHCSDKMERRASWQRERRTSLKEDNGRAQWDVEETGRLE